MKFIINILLLASSVGFANTFQVDAPQYKRGIRCQGNIQDAQVIDVMEKPDGDYDLIFSGGGVTTGPFALKDASVKSDSRSFVLVSMDPAVQISADFARKQSKILINIVPAGFGFGSVIAINTRNYICNPLFVEQ